MSSPASDTLRIAVDIGGTFTDGIAVRLGDGRIWLAKSLTTPGDPGEAVSTVIAALLKQSGRDEGLGGEAVGELVHGTTRVANAIIERDGAKVGLLLTRGSRDVLDIRREVRYDLYDLAIDFPEPLVPRARRMEVAERIASDGTTIESLDEAQLETLVGKLTARGVGAVAVCFLNACVDDKHERRAGEIVRKACPGAAVSLSSEVAREIREYERMSTTVLNAYVQPLMSDYLGRLEARMSEAEIAAPLRIMTSSGGFTSSAAAARTPIALLESGPAGGVLSAINTGQQAGVSDILAFDMGGTTAKACVCLGSRPAVTQLFETGRVRRFKKGSGLPVLLPSIDLIEVGAGGGSVAHKSTLGLLNVGPRSAGAEPGPACYGLGGTAPTVTDADLLLGYLDADDFLGGEMRLETARAEAALEELAQSLELPGEALIAGVFDLVNENMAVAARVHIAEKGVDPRRLTMVATGGAGPVHAVEVAHRIGIPRVLCSIAAGAGSCLGLLVAPARVERSWSKVALLEATDWQEAAGVLASMHGDGVAEASGAGTAASDLDWRLRLEMRYAGQGDTIAVDLSFGAIDASRAGEVEAAFEASYRALYGDVVPKAKAEIVTWRLIGRSAGQARRFDLSQPSEAGLEAIASRRLFRTDAREFGDVPVYDRYSLPAGRRLDGPLVLRERESTIVVARPAVVEILQDQTVSIDLNAEER